MSRGIGCDLLYAAKGGGKEILLCQEEMVPDLWDRVEVCEVDGRVGPGLVVSVFVLLVVIRNPTSAGFPARP